MINPQFTDLRYPTYWHYDILQALLILSRMGLVGDPRAAEALDVVERNDGRMVDGPPTATGGGPRTGRRRNWSTGGAGNPTK